ncbi:MAG: FtsK/SpoIIIE domain-containing protein [Eubacteriales bacterium]|nr:FtsK/SpoIIIE domain-containing protein [Eubacteriales bacterium]
MEMTNMKDVQDMSQCMIDCMNWANYVLTNAKTEFLKQYMKEHSGEPGFFFFGSREEETEKIKELADRDMSIVYTRIDDLQKAALNRASQEGIYDTYRKTMQNMHPTSGIPFQVNSIKDCVEFLQQLEKKLGQMCGTILSKYDMKSTSFGDLLFKSRRNAMTSQYNASVQMCIRIHILQLTLTELKEHVKSREEEFLAIQVNERKKIQEQKRARCFAAWKDKKELLLNDIVCRLNGDIPDEAVNQAGELLRHHAKRFGKVNLSEKIEDGVINMAYLLHLFIEEDLQHKDMVSIYQKKFARVQAGKMLFTLPLSMSASSSAWLIEHNEGNWGSMQKLVDTLMFETAMSVPVGKLVYSVADSVRQGFSVMQYVSVMHALPTMFGNRILRSAEEIASKIRELSRRIKQAPQNDGKIELLVVYDFPDGFQKDTLDELQTIIEQGAEHGIYMLLVYNEAMVEDRREEYQKKLEKIRQRCLRIKQIDSKFYVGNVPVVANKWDQEQFERFFEEYQIHYMEKMGDQLAYPTVLREFILEEDPEKAEALARIFGRMRSAFEENYGKKLNDAAGFPEEIVLGTGVYPAGLFGAKKNNRSLLAKAGYVLEEKAPAAVIELPVFVDLKKGVHLYLDYSEETQEAMQAFTHHIMWSFLSSVPVAKVNICVFDREKSGASITPFLEFRRRCPDVFGEKIYTSQEDMHEQLKRLNVYVDEFIQNKLGGKYQNFFEYNQNVTNRQEPVTLLVIYDFPSGMDNRNLELLLNLLRNGSRCGLYVIICHNPQVAFSHYEDPGAKLETMLRYCEKAEYRNGGYYLMPSELKLHIPNVLSAADGSRFGQEYSEKVEKIKRRGVSFENILPEEFFTCSSAEYLKIPVGIGDGDKIVNIEIGREGFAHHGLIAGATGSGKSVLLHTIITSSMLHYGPDELHLYLMDFKQGTEFERYKSARLPHLRLLALDARQEFGESILEELTAEISRRAELFAEDAGGVTKIRDYVRITGKPMPRILAIMDEFQILYDDASNRRAALHCAELTKRIVTEGRAYGIHLLMATQSTKIISNLTLDSGTVEQMRLRIGLACGEADARYLFSDANCDSALRMMKGPIGTAVLNPNYTEKSNIGFRTAYCSDELQKTYMNTIETAWADYPCAPVRIFEGKRTEKLLDYFKTENIGVSEELPVRIHLGRPIRIAPPCVLEAGKKGSQNLLICSDKGEDPNVVSMMNTIIRDYMISALLNKNSDVYCMDGELLVDDFSEKKYYDALAQYTDRFRLMEDNSDIIRMIGEIYEEYLRRKKKNVGRTIFVVIKNLPYLEMICAIFKGQPIDEFVDETEETKTEDSFGADPMAAFDFDNILSNNSKNSGEDGQDAAQKLIRMLESGTRYGIHFLVSSLEYSCIKETMFTYGQNLIARFPKRIIFEMNPRDAEMLAEDAAIAELGRNTVWYTDGKEKYQMKPYIAPEVDELKAYLMP